MEALDPHALLWPDGLALFEGKRVRLRIKEIGDGAIYTETISESFARTDFKVVVRKGCLRYYKEGDEVVVTDFILNHTTPRATEMVQSVDGQPIMPILQCHKETSDAAEVCAGLGGWSFGAEKLGCRTKVFVELSPQVARTCSETHKIPCFSIQDALHAIDEGTLPQAFVLNADVCQQVTWAVISLARPAVIMASPPCQPWSKAGNEHGTGAPEGRVLLHVIHGAKLLDVHACMMENVPGLPMHSQFKAILRDVHAIGMKVACDGLDKVYPTLPIMRERWLATLVPARIKVDHLMHEAMLKAKLPNMVPGLGRLNSIAAAGAMQTHLDEWEKDVAYPNDHAIAAMSDVRYLPEVLKRRARNNKLLAKQDVLQLRTITPRQPMPSVMPMQGSQHELPEHLLIRKGLHSWLLLDGEQVRYALPFEILKCMGFPKHVILLPTIQDAWKQAGNALTVAHSMLQCWRTDKILGDLSPFTCPVETVQDVAKAFQQVGYDLSEMQVIQDESGMHLEDRLCQMRETQKRLQPEPEEEDETLSPTQHFEIHPKYQDHDAVEDERIRDANFIDYESTIADEIIGTMAPSTGAIDPELPVLMPTDVLNLWRQGRLKHLRAYKPCKIVSDDLAWMWIGWVDPEATVGQCLEQPLPHVVQQMIEAVRSGEGYADLGDPMPSHSEPVITVEFRKFRRVVKAAFVQKDVPFYVDARWKVEDLTAMLAAEAAVLQQSVIVTHQTKAIAPGTFLLAIAAVEFRAELVATMHRPTMLVNKTSCAIEDQEQYTVQAMMIRSPLRQENINHAASRDIRCAIYNAKWGTIRTVARGPHHMVGTLLHALCPDFAANDEPYLTIDGMHVPNNALLGQLPRDRLWHVAFGGVKPWATQTIERYTQDEKKMHNAGEKQKTWIQHPFQARATEVQVDSDWTILKITAASLIDYNCDLTIVDPRIRADHLCPGHQLTLRVCGLPGGAKNAEDATKRLKTILKERGVPDEAIDARVTAILGKVPIAKIRTHAAEEPQTFWQSMKELANKHQVRMITPAELKEHQKQARKRAANAREIAAKEDTSNAKVKKIQAKQVNVNMKHFAAQNGPIPRIELTQWGPDAKGIAVVAYHEAEKLLPVTQLSADPLALLVVTTKPIQDHQPVRIPATDISNEPVMISAVLLNYGEDKIAYQPTVPQAVVPETPMQVIEVLVRKAHVHQCDDAKSPLQYLGLHLPELRTGAVVTTWNMHAYDYHRNRVPHKNADYIHGYLKITINALDQVLARSGSAGIFLQARTPDKKRDPAFSVVDMPGYGLKDLVAKAQQTKAALGVVEFGDHYAIRMRRQDFAQLRSVLQPQSIAVQEGAIAPDAQWYVLKGIATPLTCDALTQALSKVGWEASAIRPLGRYAWLLCAQAEPPHTHMRINDDLVYVQRTREAKTKEVKAWQSEGEQTELNLCQESIGDATSTVSSRFTEIRQDVETNLTEKLTAMVESRMAQSEAKIETLTKQLEHNKADQDKQIEKIKSQVDTGNQNVLQQMSTLFQQLQSNLGSRLDNVEHAMSLGEDNESRKKAKMSAGC